MQSRFEKIKMSTRSQKNLGDMRAVTGLGQEVLSRFAVCLSLKERSIPNSDEYNQEGSLVDPHVLFGMDEKIYEALMLNRLKHDKLDPEIYLNKMLRAHLNRGVISLRLRIKSLADFYTLVREERIG